MWPVPPVVLCRCIPDVLNANVTQKLGKSALEIHQGGHHFELSDKLPTELFVFLARSGHFCIYLSAAPSEPGKEIKHVIVIKGPFVGPGLVVKEEELIAKVTCESSLVTLL